MTATRIMHFHREVDDSKIGRVKLGYGGFWLSLRSYILEICVKIINFPLEMSELTTIAVVVMIMVWFSYTAAEWTITPTGLSLNGMLVMLNRTQRAVVSTTPATTLITTNQMLLLMQVSSHNTTTHIMIQSLIQISILRYANLSVYIHIIIYSRYFILFYC